MVRIAIIPIVSATMLTGAIGEAVENQIERETKTIVDMYEKTVRTWSKKPNFTQDIEIGEDIIVDIGADRSTDEGDHHFYLDYGTSVRYATMVDGYSPKTRANRVGSYGGKTYKKGKGGGVAFVSRSRPRPGIEARNWSSLIHQRRSHAVAWNLNLAIKRGTKGLFI